MEFLKISKELGRKLSKLLPHNSKGRPPCINDTLFVTEEDEWLLVTKRGNFPINPEVQECHGYHDQPSSTTDVPTNAVTSNTQADEDGWVMVPRINKDMGSMSEQSSTAVQYQESGDAEDKNEKGFPLCTWGNTTSTSGNPKCSEAKSQQTSQQNDNNRGEEGTETNGEQGGEGSGGNGAGDGGDGDDSDESSGGESEHGTSSEQHGDTSQKDSDSDDVKTKHKPSKCRVVANVRRKSVGMRNRSRSTPSTTLSKTPSMSKHKRPKSMNCDSSEDEKDGAHSRVNSKKWRRSSKVRRSTILSPKIDQPKSPLPSDSMKDSDTTQSPTITYKPFMTPALVRVRGDDTGDEFVSSSEIDIAREKRKHAALRSSGDELYITEQPTISNDEPKTLLPITNEQPRSLQPSAVIREQASHIPPFLPFPCGIIGTEKNCDLVQPMAPSSLVLLKREVHFFPDEEAV